MDFCKHENGVTVGDDLRVDVDGVAMGGVSGDDVSGNGVSADGLSGDDVSVGGVNRNGVSMEMI